MIWDKWPDKVKIRLIVLLGLGIALAAIMRLVVPPKEPAVIPQRAQVVLQKAERVGAQYAAASASRGSLAFIEGSIPTTAMTATYPGTNHCRIPGQDYTVTDWDYGADDDGTLDDLRDAFATGYNRFLIQHFPEQVSVQCRR